MHSHRTKKPCTITAESAVPFYGILKNYEWVDGYLLSVELQNDLSRLESERTALKGLKSSKKSFLEELRQSHAAYQRRREDAIARFLADHWGPDPLRTLEGYAEMKHIPAYFSWEELERSVAQLPDDGIDEPERAVKLKKIEGKIGDMKAELTI
ncbi:MAG: hypothetical protein SV686_03280, partial [Thermodesulfobacteriota bacterium]|nr:hypothetical protein [Thermodesulfobacteriota bacterium]